MKIRSHYKEVQKIQQSWQTSAVLCIAYLYSPFSIHLRYILPTSNII